MTMSTSSAPSSTTARVSATLSSIGDWPDGNAVATDATLTPLPPGAPSRRDEIRVDADGGHRRHRGSTGSGRFAFEQSAAILPVVSCPSSVVRSIIRIARSSAWSFDSRLIERFASVAARSSSATASTEPTRGSRGPAGSSNPPMSAGAWAMLRVYPRMAGPPAARWRTRPHAPIAWNASTRRSASRRVFQKPSRSSIRGSRRHFGRTLTVSPRKTGCPTSASTSGRARVPISRTIAPRLPTRMPFCDSVST